MNFPMLKIIIYNYIFNYY